MSAEGGPGTREVAYRLFACEFEDATFSYKESDEERAPNFVISPTGGRVNRLFLAGVLTEKAPVGGEQIRARVNDLTGTFVAYAGQYQPDELAFLERAEAPAFLAVTGKARTFTPDDGDRTYSSVRPESMSEVDAATRDRWVVRTARQTIDRIGTMASALDSGLRGDALREALREAGVDDSLADGTALAVEFYEPTAGYLSALRDRAVQAVEVVAGERDEVDRLDVRPGEGESDPATLASLATLELEAPEGIPASPAEQARTENEPAGETAEPAPSESEQPPAAESEPDQEAEPASATVSTDSGASADAQPEPTSESTAATEASSVEEPTTATESSTEPERTTPEPEPAATEPEPDTTTSSEPTTEPETETSQPADPEPAEADTVDSEPPADDDIEDFEPGEFDLDESERKEVEEEFGTDFETASEFDPDEESIEAEAGTEEPAEAAEEEPASEPDPDPVSEPASDSEPEPEPASDVPLDEAVIAAIKELDDGSGTATEDVVETVTASHAVSAEEVEAAIEQAMMNGECYEPSDGTLKAI